MRFLKRDLKRESTFDDIRALEKKVDILLIIVVVDVLINILQSFLK